MFVNFEFGNYRSFRDQQRFSMLAAPLRSNDDGLSEGNVFEIDNVRFLKSKAIFGGNGSGKTNFGRAVDIFLKMVFRSVVQEGIAKDIWKDRFQFTDDWDDQPVFFQYTFLLESITYRYGFRVLKEKILDEWLLSDDSHNTSKNYFFRSKMKLSIEHQNFPGTELYKNSNFSKNSELFRNDSLFLTAAALNGNKFAAYIRDEIRGVLAVDAVNVSAPYQYALKVIADEEKNFVKKFKKLILAADTGIDDLILVVDKKKRNAEDTQESPSLTADDEKRTLYSVHSKYDEDGKVVSKIKVPFAEWESGGTKKLLGIGLLVAMALDVGRTLIVDEFDAQLHPSLTLKIVNLFNNKKSNPHNAQLIFVTHDTGLLRRAELRRDQICLVDKDKFGVSKMTSLIDFKGVRKDSSYEKDYLNGIYSAVPFLDQMDSFMYEEKDAYGL